MACHQGSERDRFGTVMAGLWVAGHLAAAVLHGFTVQSQQEVHAQAVPVPHSAPALDPQPA